MNNRKKALVIAGGMWQVPLIRFLQRNNYDVTVVDPYDNSPGVLIADNHIKEDVRDKEKILSQLSDRYDLVTTDQSDISVKTVAFLSQKLNLPGNQETVVDLFTNKFLSREFASKHGIPVPKYSLVHNTTDIVRFVSADRSNYILKPCDSQSSKGIHVINSSMSETVMKQYLDDALSFSSINKAIIERFVNGYEITVEGICSNGKHKVLAISKKKHFKIGIASCLRYPALLPSELQREIVLADDLYVEKSGLSFGLTHAEYIVDEALNKFYLVEIACRGGGTLISSDIVPWVSGFNTYDALLESLNGRPIDVTGIIPLHRNAELHFFDFGEGQIKIINGLTDARAIPGVLRMDFDYNVGEHIHSCQDDRSRQGFCIVFAENEHDLQQRIEKVEETFKLELS